MDHRLETEMGRDRQQPVVYFHSQEREEWLRPASEQGRGGLKVRLMGFLVTDGWVAAPFVEMETPGEEPAEGGRESEVQLGIS